MSDMEEKYNELDLDTAVRLSESIQKHGADTVSTVAELDKRLSQTNFLTNGGAAVAVLAFIGTGANQQTTYVALALFTLGIILTGIELRAQLIYYSKLHDDISRRQNGFITNQLKVKEVLTPKGLAKIPQNINHYAGWAAQVVFGLGVLIGVIGFIAC